MILWHIERPVKDVNYDEFVGFVIAAFSEASARKIAINKARGEAGWDTCPCIEIGVCTLDPFIERIILESYNAG